jgi:hypothetical protein
MRFDASKAAVKESSLAEEVLMVDTRPRVVGFNHVALEVGDIDEALAFYGRVFRFELRGKSDSADSPQTMVAISVSSSTTRRRPAKHSRPLVLLYLMVRSLIFGTPGATE